MIHTYGAEEVHTRDKTTLWMGHTCHSSPALQSLTWWHWWAYNAHIWMAVLMKGGEVICKYALMVFEPLLHDKGGSEESHPTWPAPSLKTTEEECNILAVVFIQPTLSPTLHCLIMDIVMVFFLSMNCEQWILLTSFIQQRLCGEPKLKSVILLVNICIQTYSHSHTHIHKDREARQ